MILLPGIKRFVVRDLCGRMESNMLKSVISFGLCALMLMSAVSVEAEESDKTSAAAEPASAVSGTYSD